MNAQEFFKSRFKAEPFTQIDLLACDFAEAYAKQQGAEQQKRIEVYIRKAKSEMEHTEDSVRFHFLDGKIAAWKLIVFELEQLLK